MPHDLKDTFRTTIISEDPNAIPLIVRDLRQSPNATRYVEHIPEKRSGYSGHLINIKGQNGLTGEIQANTPEMIYAKEKPEDAIRILGAEKWNEIFKRTGIEGGKGHEMYEAIRKLPKGSPERKALEQESWEYYSHFR